MGQPQQRQWTVDLRQRDSESGERWWDEDFAHQQTIEAYLECATIQNREGGTFIIAPVRTQLQAPPDSLSEGDIWANIGLVVQHTFTPPVKQRQPEEYVPPIAQMTPEQAGQVFAPEPDEMRDEDERAVAEALGNGAREFAEEDRAMVEGDEPSGVFPQAPDPMADVDAEQSRLRPEDLLPKVG